jgi:hypothetical protein
MNPQAKREPIETLRAFAYHNGADSYYAARGFRKRLCV